MWRISAENASGSSGYYKRHGGASMGDASRIVVAAVSAALRKAAETAATTMDNRMARVLFSAIFILAISCATSFAADARPKLILVTQSKGFVHDVIKRND